jgi:triosephosphate isomerase
MSGKVLIAANWKMNKTVSETKAFIKAFNENKFENRDIIIFAPFTSLETLKELNNPIKYGAQNMHFEENGAFTGEISAEMIKELGCKYVLIGHSDRRHIFNEDDEMLNKKIKTALKNKLKIVFCVGETKEEKDAGKTEEILKSQLEIGLKNIKDKELQNITIAYEPVWAISRGDPNQKAATKEDAEQSHKTVREFLISKYNDDIASKTRIIYGGSMKPENAKELLAMENIDGGLIGGASLDPKSFAEICNA